MFPLDEQAAVCEFEAEIQGKRVVGVAKEKNQAKVEYDQAVSKGDGAYLLEQGKGGYLSLFQCRTAGLN